MPLQKDGAVRPDTKEINEIIQDHIKEFMDTGKLLDEYGLSIKNGGNISIRVPGGVLITSTGSKLSDIKPDEVVFVSAYENDKIYFCGPKRPSSETVTHWMIYQKNPSANAVIHVNTGPKEGSDTLLSEKEMLYGTADLGEYTGELLAKNPVVMMKNHGIVAIGKDLADAANKAIKNADKNKPYIFS